MTHALRVRSNDPCPHARPAGQFSAPALKATAPTHMKWAGAVAGWTGLEPATSGVTGRRSNQLSYHPLLCSGRAELSENPRRWQSLFCENNHFS